MRICCRPRFSGAAVIGALAIAGSLATVGGAQAAPVDLTYDLNLNGMSLGNCLGGICGTVSVVGDTTSSLTYKVNLATGVSFLGIDSGAVPVFYFDLTDVNPITFSGVGVSGSFGTGSYFYDPPVSRSFVPNPGNFPGPYNYGVRCGNVTPPNIRTFSSSCNSPLTFTASGATAADPFVIGSPLGGGLFSSDSVTFVADLFSESCGSARCAVGSADVGSGPGMSTVPESSTWAMMLIGFVGLGYAGYRQASAGRAAVAAA